jgi:protein-tyrosine phosphatase
MRFGVHWIEGVPTGRLAVSAAPAGGEMLEDEIKEWRAAGVEIVASMLHGREAARLSLLREPEFCVIHGMKFYNFPIVDHSVPESRRETLAFAMQLSAQLNQDRSVLVHCFAGMGRSVLIAGCVMALNGIEMKGALDNISKARGIANLPETNEQREWLLEFELGLKNKRGP